MATTVTALVVLAHGCEEMEAVIAIDVLRRANVVVVVAGLTGEETVECSRGVRVVPDHGLDALVAANKHLDFNVIVLPGGLVAARSYQKSPVIKNLVETYLDPKRNSMVACLCAAPLALLNCPTILEQAKALGDSNGGAVIITSHPCVREELKSAGWACPDGDPEPEVVVSCRGRLVTSRGPGTSFAFALKIVELLCGAETVARVRTPMMFSTSS